MLDVCMKFNRDVIVGSNDRCVALLRALKTVIADFPVKPDT